jgi:hypothetical protein
VNAIVNMRGVSLAAANPNGSFSNTLALALLNHVFVPGDSYTPPAALYVALYTTAPSNTGGGVEVADPVAYARRPGAFAAATGNPATSFSVAQITWSPAWQDWGVLTAAGLFDAAVGGNFLAFGLLLAPDGVTPAGQTVQAGDVFIIEAGALSVGLL